MKKLRFAMLIVFGMSLSSCISIAQSEERAAETPPLTISANNTEAEEEADVDIARDIIYELTRRLTLEIEITMTLTATEGIYELVFAPNAPVEDFKWLKLGHNEPAGMYWYQFYAQEVLASPQNFSPQNPFVGVLDSFEELDFPATRGISFLDENGQTRQFHISVFVNEYNGHINLNLWEFDPPLTLVTAREISDGAWVRFTRVSEEVLDALESYHLFVDSVNEMRWDFDDIRLPLIDHEGTRREAIALTTDVTLRDFRWLSLNNWFAEEGHIAETITLFSLDELTPEKPFIFAYFGLGTMPHRGMSFVDEEGITRYFAFVHNESGELINGFYLFIEYDAGEYPDTITWPSP